MGTEQGLEGGGEVERGQISLRIQVYNPAVQRTPLVGAGVGTGLFASGGICFRR